MNSGTELSRLDTGNSSTGEVRDTVTKRRNYFNYNLRRSKSKKGVNDETTAAEVEYVQLAPTDDSPYPEVRAAVPNMDDTSIPQNTLRMWVLGLVMTTLGSGLNVLFSLHSPVFSISPFVSAIVSWPLGRLWEKVVPRKKIWGIELNPGSFNIKEHALITIMANVSFGSGAAYLTNVVVAMKHFYGLNLGWGFQISSIVASQAIGYSIAGLVRRVLIYPASMIWPSNLVSSTFLTNIHMNVNHVANGWRMSRLRFFFYVLLGSFIWTWLPQYLAPFLSNFSFASWIAPNNVVINQMFGTQQGLGLIPLTFDWNMVSAYLGSPLIPPYFAIANIFACVAIIFWVVVPIIHYSNVWYNNYLPISGSTQFDRYQKPYDVSRVLDEHNTFDLKKYEAYSGIFMPTVYAVSYGVSFAAIISTIVHTIFYDGKDVLYYWTKSQDEPDDVHMRLIKRYREVPDWWFAISFILFFALAVASIRAWPTGLPVWALVLALAMAVVLLVPVAMVYALTNVSVGLNVLTEFVVGYIVPGQPIAMMLFKTFGYITNAQAVTFLQDMKLGHYLKIAPRVLFAAQLIATVWGALVQLIVMNWAQSTIADICTPNQRASFTCPSGQIFFNASVVWGLIGPSRIFGSGQLYHSMMYFFILGAILPIITWLYVRKYPKSFARYIHWPVFFNGVGQIPPATLYNYSTWCLVGHIFGFWVKRYWFNWWAKYNYSLSAGLDLGLAIGSFIIFLLLLNPQSSAPEWWGNNGGAFNTLDNTLSTLKTLSPGEWFGPSKW